MHESLLMTELGVFSNQLNNCSNNNNNNEKKWYDSVYLCIKVKEPSIEFLECYKFCDFQEADKYLNNSKWLINKKYKHFATIPVCKWIPDKFHHLFLKYKVSKKLKEKR
jgi:hypothetical protein